MNPSPIIPCLLSVVVAICPLQCYVYNCGTDCSDQNCCSSTSVKSDQCPAIDSEKPVQAASSNCPSRCCSETDESVALQETALQTSVEAALNACDDVSKTCQEFPQPQQDSDRRLPKNCQCSDCLCNGALAETAETTSVKRNRNSIPDILISYQSTEAFSGNSSRSFIQNDLRPSHSGRTFAVTFGRWIL